ncbi:hypothetical protein KHA93_20350 [Bacillus sp. FJAT-49732]|uniref:Uncharacterized protein n=1 Tax=Lederbergia citrisecunda TaxID=2833583 RepID=A0A942TSA8_9BACI|nr:DUF5696 domain-containing protein [Lederbergia citrisecunda]MBS4201961.1 hypothetical protein [Lederbergia citrisecunda]
MSRTLKIISILCIILLLGGMNPSVLANTEESDTTEAEVSELETTDVDSTDVKTTEADSAEEKPEEATIISHPIGANGIDDMKLVTSTDKLELFFNEANAEFAVKEKKNGMTWFSNPADRENDTLAAAENKGLLNAQLAINYFNPNGQTTLVDSYKDSVSKEQFEFEKIENGIKITYNFGNASKGLEQLPKKISKERFESLILDKIEDEKVRKDFAKRYKYIKEENVYERRDASFSKVILARAVKLLEEIGYTEEDLAEDKAEHGEEEGEEQNFPFFTVPLIIQLEGNSLRVNIDGSELDFNPQYPINEIQVLPFFGAANNSTEGYIFVPDGSGALIDLNNGKFDYQPFKAPIYGKDKAVLERWNNLVSETIKLPVFGMKQGDHAFFGIIEKGDAVASIEADVSGRVNSYNSIFSTYTLKESGEITLSGRDRSNTVFLIQKGEFKEDITILYSFLDGDEANYAGMAGYYQNYLIDKYQLEPLIEDDNTPFYLEITGSIWKRKTVLGIPYKSLVPLTTFSEAEKIVSELVDANINNLKVRYTGWFNEGVNHKIPSSVHIDRKIGGKKGFKEFSEFLEKKNIDFYPDVAFSNVYRNTIGFSPTRDASRFITRKVAEIYPMDLATFRQDQMNQNRTSHYLLSPKKLPSYIDGFTSDYEKLNINSLSLRDLGEQIHGDYREKNVINRQQAKEIAEEQISKLAKKFPDILAEGGNAVLFPYAKSILDAPLSSSGFNITDHSVPFYQMAIHGYIDYAGSPVNISDDQNVQKNILKALETGSNVYFSMFYKEPSIIKDSEFNHLYSAHYELWMEEAINMYNEVNEVLKDVRTKPITSHKELANGVYETTYGNDYSVIVNYNGQAAVIDGVTIEAESYKIRQGE